MTPDLGIIEGYFGHSWDWATRTAVMQRLRDAGYGFFHYAPKSDAYLRRRWREPHPADQAADIAAFSRACADADVRFGIGLSPYELYLDFNAEARAALASRLTFFNDIGVREVAILFDDMRGDLPDLAPRQAEIIDWVAAHTRAQRLIMCPSYYSNDPVLDRVFGQRPEGYLETLGELLAPEIEIYWTGEEVCSREFSAGHLRDVAAKLRRKPLLWDNYPVNDGPRMSKFLHLRAFTGRPANIAEEIAGHAVNPASQPWLGCIPALTLAASYAQGDAYCYGRAFTEAATAIVGADLAAALTTDLLTFNDGGLDSIGTERRARLVARYSGFAHPAAAEVVDWLNGGYAISGEAVQTQ
jgi:hyaluronoglucosaminidase